MDERELVRQLQSGSRAAFERLLDLHERRVYNLALRMLGNAADAEDAAQDIFVQVHRSLPTFRGDSRLDTWIHRVAVNVCLQRRRRRVLPTVELAEHDGHEGLDGHHEPAGDPVGGAVRAELRREVARAVEALPDGQREVVLLHGLQGLSYSEVAAVLGCPVGTVKSRLSAGFRRLRQLLGDYVLGEPETPARPASVEGVR